MGDDGDMREDMGMVVGARRGVQDNSNEVVGWRVSWVVFDRANFGVVD